MVTESLRGLLVSMGCQVVEDDRCAGCDLGDQDFTNIGRECRSISYRQCFRKANVTRGIAPLITHGAIRASQVSPAIRVCVPQLPNGASMVNRAPCGAQPRSRVRFVLTAVSSKNTTRPGIRAMAGERCATQSSRCRLTFARRRSVATNDFFCA